MIPDFAGQTVHDMQIDGCLRVWTEEDWEFDLNGDTYLTNARLGTVRVENEQYRDDLPDELVDLVGQQISSVLVSEQGDLAISIGDTQLSTRAGADHEAWEIGGPKGVLIVCKPGGHLAIWGPRI
ncbi:DUF6188 family protein [Intrasporangium sp.]|uniref:DUF6188 family protein n=1 Tax=Intrasporangium sp. TaxID=1925024 RepID=UPI002648D137|nr:DUF6188 family protein [Intrasporangium sp.]